MHMTKSAGNERCDDQHGQRFRRHGDEIAHHQHRADDHEHESGGEPELQAEKHRENHGHAHKGSIAGHHYVLLQQSEISHHLRHCRKIDSSGKLEAQGEKDTEADPDRIGNPLLEEGHLPRHLNPAHSLTEHSTFIPARSLSISSGLFSPVKTIFTGILCSTLTKFPAELS